MKHSATSSELAAQPEVARASWSLPEPTLTYFPNARFASSDRDLDAGAHPEFPGGPVVVDDSGPESGHGGHIPVLLDRCVEILGPALTRSDAVLVDATLGAGGHSE